MFKGAANTARKGYADNGEKSPKHRKEQAYLTEKVKGLVAVIPHAFFENDVENKAENKLNYRDGKTSENAFVPQPRFAAFGNFRE